MQHIKKWLIPLGIGLITIAAYAWKAPDELHRAIPDSVIVTSTLVQMLDKKQDPPDDQNGSK
ncbi:hypothetical protein NG796_24155 [Laspinema sp. A4]|uniref:hypothetical protein n=1 Tax=Laspinema sp. D2d TaxID=2953686 RepID=UPI0021BA6390|nr:hypothetical protein [Laspinema sp. D2d]MCT7986368.1 hypothetical protein [Laspinema sp. D2d]